MVFQNPFRCDITVQSRLVKFTVGGRLGSHKAATAVAVWLPNRNCTVRASCKAVFLHDERAQRHISGLSGVRAGSFLLWHKYGCAARFFLFASFRADFTYDLLTPSPYGRRGFSTLNKSDRCIRGNFQVEQGTHLFVPPTHSYIPASVQHTSTTTDPAHLRYAVTSSCHQDLRSSTSSFVASSSSSHPSCSVYPLVSSEDRLRARIPQYHSATPRSLVVSLSSQQSLGLPGSGYLSCKGRSGF